MATVLGYPDGERISAVEMLDIVARIARVVEVPVTADLEAGYGDVERTVRGTVQAGAAGLNLEDGNGPMDAHVERLRTARATAEELGVPLVLNARVDVFLPGGSGDVDEAVERGNAYLDAGADCAYPIWVTDREIVRRLVDGIRGPINVHAAVDAPLRRRAGHARRPAASASARCCTALRSVRRAKPPASSSRRGRTAGPSKPFPPRMSQRRSSSDRRPACTARGRRLRPRRPPARHGGGVDVRRAGAVRALRQAVRPATRSACCSAPRSRAAG